MACAEMPPEQAAVAAATTTAASSSSAAAAAAAPPPVSAVVPPPSSAPTITTHTPPQYYYIYHQWLHVPSDAVDLNSSDNEDDDQDAPPTVSWGSFLRFNTGNEERKLDEILGIAKTEPTRKRQRTTERKDTSSLTIEEEQNEREGLPSKKAKRQQQEQEEQEQEEQEQEQQEQEQQEQEQQQQGEDITTIGDKSDEDESGTDGSETADDSVDDSMPSLSLANTRRRTWDDNFALLIKYKEEKNNTWVPYKYPKDQAFAYWVHAQRKLYTQRKHGNAETLSDERFMYLDSIGFEEERQDEQEKTSSFKKRLAELKAFKKEFRHTRVPRDYDDVPGLRKWVVKMRRLYKQGGQGPSADLTQEEIDALDDLGFQWRVQGRSNAEKKTKERAHRKKKEEKKHKRFHEHESKHDNNKNKSFKKSNKGNKKKSGEGEIDASWLSRFQQLEQYKNDHGDLKVPSKYGVDQSFATWFHGERVKFSARARGEQQAFSDKKYQAFEQLGVEPANLSFAKGIKYLKMFKKQHGHTRVPEDNGVAPQLRKWVVKVRKQFKAKLAGKPSGLTRKQIEELQVLGFEYEAKKEDISKTDVVKKKENEPVANNLLEEKGTETHQNQLTNWERRLGQLKEYKRVHGHTLIPENHEDDHFMAWVKNMRDKFTKRLKGDETVMSDKRFRALKDLGFEAGKDEKKKIGFKTRLSQLRQFYQEHGHFTCPMDYEKAPGLGDWVSRIREKYKLMQQGEKDAIPEKCYAQLKAIGFTFVDDQEQQKAQEADAAPAAKESSKEQGNDEMSHSKGSNPPFPENGNQPQHTADDETDDEDSFENRLSQLQAFAHQFGTTRVPKDYDVIPGLFQFVKLTRKAYHQRQQGNGLAISDEEIRALDEINFDWSLSGKKKQKENLNSGKTRQRKESLNASWLSRLNQLKEFQKANGGSTLVPLRDDFGHWVKAQRELFDRKKDGDHSAMAEKRFQALKELGFGAISNGSNSLPVAPRVKVEQTKNQSKADEDETTEPRISQAQTQLQPPAVEADKSELSWSGRLQQLKEYKKTHSGSTKVPNVYEPDQAFSNWVRAQRRLLTRRVRGDKDALPEDRFHALKNLGFQPSAVKSHISTSFDKRIGQLREFKEQYGHINVTPNNTYDDQFYSWVVTQRAQFGKKKRGEKSNLNEMRYVALQSLGFE